MQHNPAKYHKSGHDLLQWFGQGAVERLMLTDRMFSAISVALRTESCTCQCQF